MLDDRDIPATAPADLDAPPLRAATLAAHSRRITDDELLAEARDLIRYFGATVEEIAEWLEIEPAAARVLHAKITPRAEA